MATHPASDGSDASAPSADLARPAETTVRQLLDRIARAGRCHGLPGPVEQLEEQESAAGTLRLPGWITDPGMPEWLAQTQRRSTYPTPAKRWPLPGQAGGILVGPPRTGKTSQSRQLRAAPENSGVPFQERTSTDEHGQEHADSPSSGSAPLPRAPRTTSPDGRDRTTQFDGAGTKPEDPRRPPR
ncbi:hypothetical protein [Streptomyces venezuelae]|uniref:hypothetical protein n=1 Tax=Streptomyces venezuelae TaxID=54571 RepID=UPI00341FA9F5